MLLIMFWLIIGQQLSGCTLVLLKFGHEKIMPLNVLLPVVVENIKHNDKLLQKAQKHKLYRHHRCKKSFIKVGDHVKIRDQHKLQSDFTDDVFIVEQLVGKNAVRLGDGHVWNLQDCLYVNTPIVKREENTVIDFDEP